MAQGLGAGILWGAVAGTAVVVGLAQVAPVVTLPSGTLAAAPESAAQDTPSVTVPSASSAETVPAQVTEPAPKPAQEQATGDPAPAPAVAADAPAAQVARPSLPPTAAQPPVAQAPGGDAPGDTARVSAPDVAPDVATDAPPAPGAPDAVAVPTAPSRSPGNPPAPDRQTAPAAPGSETVPATREAAPPAPAATQDLAAPVHGDTARTPRPDVPALTSDTTASAVPDAPAILTEPPQDAPVADVGTVPAPPPAPPPAAPPEAATPEVATAPAIVAEPPVEAAPDAIPNASVPAAPEAAPAPTAPPAGVRVGRLPRIGDDTAPEVGTDSTDAPPLAALPGMPGRPLPTQPAPATPAPEAPATEDLGALAAFAVPFDNPDNRPVLSIVLVDTAPGDRPAVDALASFPFPLTVALDPTDAGAAETMRAYRAAGIEIAAFVRFPDDATAQDVAVTWDVHRTTLAESVALVDASDGAIQSRREPMAQVVAELVRSGHGFVTMSQGFNAGQKLAAREGVPSALVFRSLDPADRGAMTRALDQGAFRAGQDGRAVLTAPLSAETLAILAEWGLGTRQAVVALAPLSAALD